MAGAGAGNEQPLAGEGLHWVGRYPLAAGKALPDQADGGT